MTTHRPVMLEEVMTVLRPRDDAIYVDGTFGGGGYSQALLERADCVVYGIDRDESAIRRGQDGLGLRFKDRLILIHGRFSEMQALLAERGVAKADGIALDIGVSSFQLDESARGFSFSHDAFLDMRMDASTGESAADILNTRSEAEIADILKRYGEENRARTLARAIVAVRPITRTSHLAELVEKHVGRGASRIHPATRTFQALRIAVNDELGELERGLAAAEHVLKPGARLAVVSFHSLEDRIVKQFLAERGGRVPSASRHAPQTKSVPAATFRPLGKAPTLPSDAEIAANPRARSAKLRAAERLNAPAKKSGSRGDLV